MLTLSDLKPTTKMLIIDAVSASGIDVSTWKLAKEPSTNPKYCYEWGFLSDAKDQALLCLWFDDLQEDENGIYEAGNVRNLITRLEAKGAPTARRARALDIVLQDSWRTKPHISVAVVDETEKRKANKVEGDSSKAAFRELDAEPWFLAAYDMMSGDYLLRRGHDGGSGIRVDSRSDLLAAPKPGQPDGDNPPIPDPSDTQVAADILAITQRDDVPSTVRETWIEARIGQGKFRRDLISVWQGQCAVTQCNELAILRASHIKPWCKCADNERLDPSNGLLLTANLDALFDVGLISFEPDGTMLVSSALPSATQVQLGLPASLRQSLTEAQLGYLNHHREHRFKA